MFMAAGILLRVRNQGRAPEPPSSWHVSTRRLLPLSLHVGCENRWLLRDAEREQEMKRCQGRQQRFKLV
jgi:hypothetical protein